MSVHPQERPSLPLRGFGLAAAFAIAAAMACGSDPFEAADGASGGTSGRTSGGLSGTGDRTGAGTNGGGRGGRSTMTNEGGAAGGAEGGAGENSPIDPSPGGAPSSLTCEANQGDCNEDPADGCEAMLDSATDCGRCKNACTAPLAPYCAKAANAYSCVNPAQTLVGQRLELGCASANPMIPELCASVVDRAVNCPKEGGKLVKHTFTMGGQAGVTYDVTLRIRGVVEPKTYAGGQASPDHFYVGGAPVVSNYNVFSLAVSAPAKSYFLNYDAQPESYHVFALDHTKVVPITAGATVTLQVVDADCALVRNCQSFVGACKPYVPAGVPPAPAGFDGQFVDIDVVGVAKAK